MINGYSAIGLHYSLLTLFYLLLGVINTMLNKSMMMRVYMS